MKSLCQSSPQVVRKSVFLHWWGTFTLNNDNTRVSWSHIRIHCVVVLTATLVCSFFKFTFQDCVFKMAVVHQGSLHLTNLVLRAPPSSSGTIKESPAWRRLGSLVLNEKRLYYVYLSGWRHWPQWYHKLLLMRTKRIESFPHRITGTFIVKA